MWDIAFPGTVMMLKLVFKLTIEQQMKPVDVAKAVLAFPIDMAFLSFSFAAAIVYSREDEVLHDLTLRGTIALVISSVIVLLLTTTFAKKSDAAFTLNRFVWMFCHVICAYVFSITAMLCALHAGTLL